MAIDSMSIHHNEEVSIFVIVEVEFGEEGVLILFLDIFLDESWFGPRRIERRRNNLAAYLTL